MTESLGGVALYNPHLLNDEELVSLFVVRERLLGSILGDLPGTDDGGAPQSQLILGQRGMGKTMLLRRIACEIDQRDDLAARWLALTFPEEQYDVASLGDFWRNCLDALGDALERRGQDQEAEDLDRRVLPITPSESDGRQAIELLQETVQRLDRGLVLLVDNVDLIFDRIGGDDQWTFREVLSESSRIALIGASAHAMEATYKYGAAFYDFFRVRELRGLDLDETCALLQRLASRMDEPAVTEIVESEPGRIRALHELTGGNPRTTVLLFQVLAQGIDGDVRGDLERLLDQSTPLYKARVEAFAPQAQRTLHGLALAWDPVTASDLAERLGMDVNAVSSQLSRLVKDGVVEKVDYEPDTRSAFQIAERFFNIWYLMRASRRVRRRLVWLVELLRIMYSPADLGSRALRDLDALRGQPRDRLQRAAEYQFALALGVEDPVMRYTEAESAYRKAIERAPGEIERRGFSSNLAWLLFRQEAGLDEAEELARFAATGAAPRPDWLRIAATILTRNGKWTDGQALARQFLRAGDDAFLDRAWDEIVIFFREAVAQGHAGDAASLLDEVGLAERWRPLREALEAIVQGKRRYLLRVAPEVRTPAEALLDTLMGPDWVGEAPPTKKRARQRTRRRK